MCIRSEKLEISKQFKSRNNIEIEDKRGLNSFAFCNKHENNKVIDGIQSFSNVNSIRKSKRRWLFSVKSKKKKPSCSCEVIHANHN